MAKGNIFVRAAQAIRPWQSGERFTGISIVDTAGAIRERVKGILPVRHETEPDPETTSWPIALSNTNVPARYPTGILSRTNPLTGDLPPYEEDDAEIILRLFGHAGPERLL